MHLRTLAALASALVLPTLASAAEDQVARGEYLSRIMDCGGCHTPMGEGGEPDEARKLSGGSFGFELPGLGTFYPPNLTDHPTGLADWTDEEIAAALRTGHRPDGRVLAPIMPWKSYSVISDEDLGALVAYLRSLEGVENAVPGPVGPGEAPPAPFLRLTGPDGKPLAG